MKLNAWLKQNPASSERLQVVERLAQALNTVHDRGEPLAALDPDHVDVGGDGDCDISAARRGNPAPGYCAPERAEGGPPSPEADIYAAGAIAWEVLSGRPYAAAPSHLAEAARDVPRELADAVMACLEQSPQWRPRDLTYIAQLAQHTLGKGSRAEQGGSRTASVRSASRPASARSAAAEIGTHRVLEDVRARREPDPHDAAPRAAQPCHAGRRRRSRGRGRRRGLLLDDARQGGACDHHSAHHGRSFRAHRHGATGGDAARSAGHRRGPWQSRARRRSPPLPTTRSDARADARRDGRAGPTRSDRRRPFRLP